MEVLDNGNDTIRDFGFFKGGAPVLFGEAMTDGIEREVGKLGLTGKD